jgi:hypothetical protein
MNKLIVSLLLLITTSPLLAKDIKEFHRLILTNDKEQILVVKIKKVNFWVTQGLYSKHNEDVNNKLHNQAAAYGLTITRPRLRGTFVLEGNSNTSNRHFYTAKLISGNLTLPENIEAAKWLTLDEAIEKITFPHIKTTLKQVINNPSQVWGGSIRRYKENGEFKSKITKDFYPIKEL